MIDSRDPICDGCAVILLARPIRRIILSYYETRHCVDKWLYIKTNKGIFAVIYRWFVCNRYIIHSNNDVRCDTPSKGNPANK